MGYRALVRIASAAVVACVTLAAAEATAEPDAGVYGSEAYPIRIFSDDAELGAAALAEAEAAWEEQIVGIGFPPPKRVAGGAIGDGFDAWLDGDLSSGVLVTFDILGDDPATAATDCPTIGRLNPIYMDDAAILGMSIRHVLNHGSLHAVDCVEPQMPAFDMFTVAVEVMTGDGGHPYWLPHYLPAFQSLPWASVDYVVTNMDYVYYMFGSALFTLFLDEKYGAGDGALLVDAWARTPQDGTILTWDQEWCTADVDNEPDFLDGIAAELGARGATMDEALVAFTEWRYFVGGDDDGAHFADGAAWVGGEVARDASLGAADLPVAGAGPASRLAETGSAYIEIDPAGLDPTRRLAVAFEGDAAARWAAQLLLVPADGAATVVPIALAGDRIGESGDVDFAPYASVVLAVTLLGDGAHDPEDHEWTNAAGGFEYSIEVRAADGGADGGPDADADAGELFTSGGSASACSCRAVGDGRRPTLLPRIF